jgi:hypothetical protein
MEIPITKFQIPKNIKSSPPHLCPLPNGEREKNDENSKSQIPNSKQYKTITPFTPAFAKATAGRPPLSRKGKRENK